MNLGTVEISQESTHVPWECPLDDAVELPTVLINAAPTWECGSFHNEKQVFSSGQRRAAYFTSGLGVVLLASAPLSAGACEHGYGFTSGYDPTSISD